jgi:hypothetical protein
MLLDDPETLPARIQCALQAEANRQPPWNDGQSIHNGLSVVLLLLGICSPAPDRPAEPCLILNKRSSKVRQPGDICCPGGGIAPRRDRLGAHLLRLPGTPLRQWIYYRFWRRRAPQGMSRLRMLLATALREGAEEMRLNPLGVGFQGMLPPEHLVMFNRTIYPMVGWVHRQQRFFPNWEVERIVRIPVRALLVPTDYIRLRLTMAHQQPATQGVGGREFAAFRYRSPAGVEILWGATYRIVMAFLQRVFNFLPPEIENGPVVEKRLTAAYLTGEG